MSSTIIKHPLILWAQRSPHLYLSVEVGDLKVDELVIDEDKFKIKGIKGDDRYEAELEFYGKLKGAERKKIATDRRIEFVIPKEAEEWWPRLLKEKTKVPWIKVDFDKWKDEDEEKDEDAFGGMDFSSFGLPTGGKGYDDLDLGEDDGGDLDDMGELEDADDEETANTSKSQENGEEQTKEGTKSSVEEKSAQVVE